MHARPLVLTALAGVFSLVLVSSGCEGDSGGGVTDGSIERPGSAGSGGGFGGGSGGRGGGGGTTVDARQAPDTPPPVPNTASVRILPGGTDLLGSFQNGCTFGPGGERWCAVSRQVALTKRELWFVNVTKAAAMNMTLSSCTTVGLCVNATDALYTSRPEGGPAYPEDAARASGNTFIYLRDPISGPSDAFQGDVWAYTVGAPQMTKIGDNVFDCAVAGQRYINLGKTQINKVVGICATEPASEPMAAVNFFTLHAGVVQGQDVPSTPLTVAPMNNEVPGAQLPKLTEIYPVHPMTQAARWRVGFSADGETVILSNGGPAVTDTEKLQTIATSTIGAGGTLTTIMNGENVTRWTLSADGKKIYYFKEYNYNAQGNQSGTLVVADFPSGANAKEIKGAYVPGGAANGVGSYRVLVNETGLDSGVGVMSGLAMGQGNYAIVKNTAGSFDDMANVVPVVQGTRSLPLPAPKLDFHLFAKTFSMDSPTSDIWIRKSDGTGECRLTAGELGGIFGFPFIDSSRLVFWADNYDAPTLSAEGWLADPADCLNLNKKKKFADNVDFWFVDADRLLLYSDQSNGSQVSLKYAFITNGVLQAPVTIQTRAERFFQIVLDAQPTDGSPARFKGLIYTLVGGGDSVDGAYYYELPAAPGGGPTPDAAAGN
jgi:hypothetical protein